MPRYIEKQASTPASALYRPSSAPDPGYYPYHSDVKYRQHGEFFKLFWKEKIQIQIFIYYIWIQ